MKSYLLGTDILGANDAETPTKARLPRFETMVLIVGAFASVATLVDVLFMRRGLR